MNPELDKLLDTWFESHKGLSPSRRAIEELVQTMHEQGWADCEKAVLDVMDSECYKLESMNPLDKVEFNVVKRIFDKLRKAIDKS